MRETYATVHRGVYQRSAEMTLAFEAARRRVAALHRRRRADEIVFVRGATEGINLVAQSWGGAHLKPGDRILLSMLEHHSQHRALADDRRAHRREIDVAPLTADGRIDLDAMAAMLTERHKLVALAHVSNVLGSVLDARRAAELAHAVGAKLLLDGCQAVPRMPVDVAALGCDFYVFSGHKLYGPTGIGVLWARAEILDAMPPWQGGGAMIDRVTLRAHHLRAAAGAVRGGDAACRRRARAACGDRLCRGDRPRRDRRARGGAGPRDARRARPALNSVRLFGPEDAAGIVSFAIEGVHPHDIGTILDESRVAIRAGHHCAQPLMAHLGVRRDGAGELRGL